MVVMYGIKNCDTIKKARRWLEAHQIEYRFHDYRADGLERAQLDTFIAELGWQALLNTRGTIAMARTADKDSATSQFFINVADNAFLDHGQRDFGYAVFGKVVKGMDVADKISQVQTHDVGPYQNVPSKPVVILSAKVLP